MPPVAPPVVLTFKKGFFDNQELCNHILSRLVTILKLQNFLTKKVASDCLVKPNPNLQVMEDFGKIETILPKHWLGKLLAKHVDITLLLLAGSAPCHDFLDKTDVDESR
eukprot:Pompholyxophrys_punicea_v1_NODE_10_length_6905_cov_7.951686.p9 type:complete len:109 gc:universal NODE_10_length_6905_cov_7.951686:2645-2971(+)